MLSNRPPQVGMLGQRPIPSMLGRQPPAQPPPQNASLGTGIDQPQQGALGNQVQQPPNVGSVSMPQMTLGAPALPSQQIIPNATPMKISQPGMSNSQHVPGYVTGAGSSGLGASIGSPGGMGTAPGSNPTNMNQYAQSPNMSTLIRSLVGNTTTAGV